MTVSKAAGAHKANVEALFGLTSKAFKGVEKLVELNLRVAKTTLGGSTENARAALSVKDAQELLALQVSLLRPAAEKAAAYSRRLYDIASATTADLSKLVEAQTSEAQSNILAAVDATVKDAPAGTENAAKALVHSAVAAASLAFEGAQRAAKHASNPPQVILRAALEDVMLASRLAAGGVGGHKGETCSDKIGEAAQFIEMAFGKVVDERLAMHTSTQDSRFVAPVNYVPGRDAALAAGAQARTAIFRRSDLLSSQDVGERLGVSRETVNQRRRNRHLLALQHESRGFRYPAWQLEPGVRDVIADVLAEIGEKPDCWAIYLFFTQSNPLLGGATPLQALLLGKSAEVLRAASGLREELA